ncbi:MAG: protein-L-isoaspartate O-methyltransferase, partial [Rhodobacteraceae bacterium]|nr:protein-L-isoaspartate O-methyltransferase [Paracoccaceae bacterium]
TQVRPSDVTKFPIIDAMLQVPREEFVPPNHRDAAYIGENVDLGDGRVVLEPRTLGKMLDALDIQRDEVALDIGPGLGYSSALLARMADAVVAVEEEGFAGEAEQTLSQLGYDNVAVMSGPLAQGAAKHGPYDIIMIQGGVETVPQGLTDQLKDNGRIVCIFMENQLGVCRIGHKSQNGLNWRFAFNASAPILSAFAADTEFAL